jgi:hypothetical protein
MRSLCVARAPSAAEAALNWGALRRGLKPRPFKTVLFQNCSFSKLFFFKTVLFQNCSFSKLFFFKTVLCGTAEAVPFLVRNTGGRSTRTKTESKRVKGDGQECPFHAVKVGAGRAKYARCCVGRSSVL